MEKVFLKSVNGNLFEEEVMRGILRKGKFNLQRSEEGTNITILNIGPHTNNEKEVLKELKKEDLPEKLVIVGCMSRKRIADIRKINHTASLLDSDNIEMIIQVVEETLNGNMIEAVIFQNNDKLGHSRILLNSSLGYIPILSGCSDACLECRKRLKNHKLRSLKKEEIKKEATLLIEKGCKQIILKGQTSSAYGTENIWRSSLPELLAEMIAIEGDFHLKIGEILPHNLKPILDEMVQVYKSEKVYKHISLPLYTGNDDILTSMEKNFTVDEYRSFVNTLKREIPHLSLQTKVVVGFAQETVDQFNETLDIVKEISPDELEVEVFSGKNVADKVDQNIVKDRVRIITEIHGNISRLNNEKWHDWKGEVTVEQKGEHDSWICRNLAYKPIQVLGNFQPNQRMNVKIINTFVDYLKGEKV